MTTRTAAAPTGAPCWIDLATTDEAGSHAFYGELFGWTVDDPGTDYGGYKNLLRDGVPVAGCMPMDPEMAVNMWSVHLAVDDAEQTASAAPTVFSPAMDVMALGRMAILGDPGGDMVGAWQAGEHVGFGVVGEPNAPGWFELHTKSYDDAVAFYRDVFSWPAVTVADEPGFRYTTYGSGDDQLAGIIDSSVWAEDVAGWHVYFTVADADDTVARAVALGATVVDPAEDTPYGRLATLLDPNGARFKLQQP